MDGIKNDDEINGQMNGGRRHRGSKKRHGNASLRAWVTFVKKVQREEKVSYKEAMMRAKKRKDNGEKWRGGALMGGEEMIEDEVFPDGDEVVESEEMVGGKRRRRTRKNRGSKKRKHGRKSRRHR
jgi:hypothetical protein